MLHHNLRSVLSSQPDSYFKYTALLLSGEGSNGGQNNTLIDSSANNFSVSRSVSVVQGTFSPFGYNWSNYFGGNSYIVSGSSTQLDLAAGDFTVEGWFFYTPNKPAPHFIQNGANGSSRWVIYGLNEVFYFYVQNGSGINRNTSTAIPSNQWFHLAITKHGVITRLFLNGSQFYREDNITTYPSTGQSQIICVGYQNFNAYLDDFYTGYVSNVRAIKGTALYTANFTPPTAPLTAITNTSLLTCQSNRFLDNSSNAFAITPYGDVRVTNNSPFGLTNSYDQTVNGGSLFCYGGDITSANSSVFAFGTGDFTLECWTYPVQTNYSWMFDFRQGNYDQPVPALYAQSGATYYYVSADTKITGAALTQKAWNHVALSRVSGTTRLFINGQQTGGDYVDSVNYQQAAFKFNRNEGGLTGSHIVSGIRVVKGTGLYSSNFSVPTSPPTAVSGTSILLNFTNASIVDSSGKNALETIGDAQVSTAVKKFGVSSLKFDGVGDYLNIYNYDPIDFLSGDFTVECWNYSTSSGSDGIIYLSGLSNGYAGFRLSPTYLLISTTGNSWLFTDAVWSADLNTWNHLAVTRSGSTLKVFVNGTAVVTKSISGSLYSGGSQYTIGRYQENFSTYYYFTGYIDDLRITKGIARYTSNFPPPTKSLPTK